MCEVFFSGKAFCLNFEINMTFKSVFFNQYFCVNLKFLWLGIIVKKIVKIIWNNENYARIIYKGTLRSDSSLESWFKNLEIYIFVFVCDFDYFLLFDSVITLWKCIQNSL